MADAPLVSIVMPAFNCVRFIEEAVESARAQNWQTLELVAVDDGSADGTDAHLETLAERWNGPGRRMEVLRQSNAGAAAARNAGIARARGAFIALFDADDVYHPELVAACMAQLRDLDADIAFARARAIDAEGRPIYEQSHLPPRLDALDLLDGKMVNHPVIRRDAIEAVGGHDVTLRAGIDLDLFVRIALRREAPIRVDDRILSDYRRRDGQITGNWRGMEAGWRHAAATLRRADPGISETRLAEAHARKCLFWAEIAYKAGDYAAARRLMWTACRTVPREAFSTPHTYIRLASCAASFLPRPLHDGIRRRFNASFGPG